MATLGAAPAAQRRPSPLSDTARSSHGMSMDNLLQRAPAALAQRHAYGIDTSVYSPPQTPASAVSEMSTTPTTPHGHPLSGPFSHLYGPQRTQATPVPVLAIIPLCIARVAEGLIFAVIFPYINEMMHDFGVPEEQVGIWSATAESVLMVTESIAAPLYAPLADRFGRRTVFVPLVGLWGVSALIFGFAHSPWSTVVLRGALGLLAGAGVISRTMCGELCDKSNRIKGFALFSPAFTIGVTIAPLVGGFLSRPVPRLLSESWTLFADWPYLLPSLVTAVVGGIASFLAYLWLPETLPPRLRNTSAHRYEAEKANSGGGLKHLLTYPKFQNVLILYGLNNGVMFSWEALFPLFAFTGKSIGGLGLSTQQIGVVLSISAALSIVMTIFMFPILHKSMSEANLLRICLFMYPLAVTLFPLLWALSHRTGYMPMSACTILGIQMILRRVGDFASTLLDTIVLDSIPGPEYLAMANSATFSMAAIGRAIGPFIVSSFFSLATTSSSAMSAKRQLVWLVFCLVSVPSMYYGERVMADTASTSDEELQRLEECTFEEEYDE